MTTLEDVAATFGRARSLLSLKRAGVALAAAPPPWQPAGALAGLGLAAEGLAASIGLYLFEDGTAAQAAALALRTTLQAKGGYVVAGTNGALMFIGHLPESGDEDVIALDRVASAFAGDE
ncbi:MAG: hypothetical protein C0506_04570 [Anaerolinea sp.]|nr:hypothetical protein [Anaerolinea sp.]